MSRGPTRRDVLAGGAALSAGLALPTTFARSDTPLPLLVVPEPLDAERLRERLGAVVPAGLVLVAEGPAPAGIGLACLSPCALALLAPRAADRLLPLPPHGLHLPAPARLRRSDDAEILEALARLVADPRAAPHTFALALRDGAAANRLARLLDAARSPRALHIL